MSALQPIDLVLLAALGVLMLLGSRRMKAKLRSAARYVGRKELL